MFRGEGLFWREGSSSLLFIRLRVAEPQGGGQPSENSRPNPNRDPLFLGDSAIFALSTENADQANQD
jgi:hypothetical protein